jgi:predicted Rossmann-fold nucleotide-binding protein
LTWSQLGLHLKPCGLLNVNGFYDPFLAQIQHAIDAQFIPPEHRALIQVEDEAVPLLERLVKAHPPRVEKWIKRDET